MLLKSRRDFCKVSAGEPHFQIQLRSEAYHLGFQNIFWNSLCIHFTGALFMFYFFNYFFQTSKLVHLKYQQSFMKHTNAEAVTDFLLFLLVLVQKGHHWGRGHPKMVTNGDIGGRGYVEMAMSPQYFFSINIFRISYYFHHILSNLN